MLIITAPGQGAQTPGFLAPWLDVPGVAERLGAASELIGRDLIRLGTTASADEIKDTAVAQPLLVAAALAAAGALAHTAVAWRVVLAILGPVLFAVIWGRAIGPRAAHRLSDPLRLLVEIVIFVVSAVALGLVGYLVIGVVLALISIATAAALRAVMPGS